jgi:hypothetical protein
MRLSGAFILVLLFALAIVLMLRAREVEHVEDDLQRMVPNLMESGVQGEVMSHRVARDRIEELEGFCHSPNGMVDRVARLREVVAEAASWAAGAPSPSPELSAAVALRAAADSLREYALHPSDGVLRRAENQLAEARDALDGGDRPTALSTDGLRDRVRNIEQSQREKLRDLEEAQ